MVESNRVKKLVRTYMAEHPAVKYQKALSIVTSKLAGQPSSWFDAMYETLTHRAGAQPDSATLRVPLGVFATAAEAPQVAELMFGRDDQPGQAGAWVLILGATGSGKSEAFQTILMGAGLHSPKALEFVMIDPKGGHTFARVAQLPHSRARKVYTGHAEIGGAVQRLTRETQKRQNAMSAAGCSTWHSYRELAAAGAVEVFPEILVAIDELDYVRRYLPRAYSSLVNQLAEWRLVGIHGLFADQRPPAAEILKFFPNRLLLRLHAGTGERGLVGAPPGVGMLAAGEAYLCTAASPEPRLVRLFNSSADADRLLNVLADEGLYAAAT